MNTRLIDKRLNEIVDALYRVSAKAVIVQGNKILLVKENVHNWWGLPGGGVDHGESVQETLKREISEELGLNPDTLVVYDQILQVIFGKVINHVPRLFLLYRVDIPPNAPIKITDHVQGCEWYSATELKELYITPSISDVTVLSRYLQD
jgi:8-oxo-dGTP diphosphatase